VTPISLGIFASANQSAAATSFESIATTTVGAGGASSISFSSIPGTYKHLQLKGILRDNSANNYDNVSLRFNSDSGSNYASHYLAGNGASASAYAWTSAAQIESFYTAGGAAISNMFSAVVIDILDYANTSKYKTTRQLVGYDNNGNGGSDFAKGAVLLSSGLWQSTSAISSITLTVTIGSNFAQYSHFALYGIKSS
jgi:hypothetical protein